LNLRQGQAARASLEDADYVATVRTKVKAERDAWHELFCEQKIGYANSQGNFVFFDAGRPHHEVATTLAAQGIEIGRNQWATRYVDTHSIGLPEDNGVARQAIEHLLR
jgi:histidinol-phosphate aminotransferase